MDNQVISNVTTKLKKLSVNSWSHILIPAYSDELDTLRHKKVNYERLIRNDAVINVGPLSSLTSSVLKMARFKRHLTSNVLTHIEQTDRIRVQLLPDLVKGYSVATIFFRPTEQSIFVSCLICFSSSSNELMQQLIDNNMRQLYKLKNDDGRLLKEHHLRQNNPWVNLGVVSAKSIKILQMIGHGYSSEEISDLICMTPRGVNYHVDNLKELLNANNRAHLVMRGFTLEMINC